MCYCNAFIVNVSVIFSCIITALKITHFCSVLMCGCLKTLSKHVLNTPQYVILKSPLNCTAHYSTKRQSSKFGRNRKKQEGLRMSVSERKRREREKEE